MGKLNELNAEAKKLGYKYYWEKGADKNRRVSFRSPDNSFEGIFDKDGYRLNWTKASASSGPSKESVDLAEKFYKAYSELQRKIEAGRNDWKQDEDLLKELKEADDGKRPSSSIWGRPDHCKKLAPGVYTVDTPSHGGIMVSASVASKVLSPETLAHCSGLLENGYYQFEEDCDAAIPLVEMYRKGISEGFSWNEGRQAKFYELAQEEVLKWNAPLFESWAESREKEGPSADKGFWLTMTRVLPKAQLEEFKEDLHDPKKAERWKKVARAVASADKVGTQEGDKPSPLVLHYVNKDGTEYFVTEINDDNTAWGFRLPANLSEGNAVEAAWVGLGINGMKASPNMRLDPDVPEGMTVEAALCEKRPDFFPQFKEFTITSEGEFGNLLREYGVSGEKVLDGLSERQKETFRSAWAEMSGGPMELSWGEQDEIVKKSFAAFKGLSEKTFDNPEKAPLAEESDPENTPKKNGLKTVHFSVYQVKSEPDETSGPDADLRSVSYQRWDNLKVGPIRANYNKVYDGAIMLFENFSGNVPEQIFSMLEGDERPDDYISDSPSMGDVFVVGEGANKSAHYCDFVGFKNSENEKALRKFLEDDKALYEKSPLAGLSAAEKDKICRGLWNAADAALARKYEHEFPGMKFGEAYPGTIFVEEFLANNPSLYASKELRGAFLEGEGKRMDNESYSCFYNRFENEYIAVRETNGDWEYARLDDRFNVISHDAGFSPKEEKTLEDAVKSVIELYYRPDDPIYVDYDATPADYAALGERAKRLDIENWTRAGSDAEKAINKSLGVNGFLREGGNVYEPKPVALEDIVAQMDFRLEVTESGKLKLWDLQRNEYLDNERLDGSPFGSKPEEYVSSNQEFSSAEEIFDRLDSFIRDYFYADMASELERVGAATGNASSLYDLCELWKAELGKGSKELSKGELNLALGIVNPDTVIMPEEYVSAKKDYEKKLKDFNELVYEYGASGTKALEGFSEEQRLAVRLAWKEFNEEDSLEKTDEKINSHFEEFMAASKPAAEKTASEEKVTCENFQQKLAARAERDAIKTAQALLSEMDEAEREKFNGIVRSQGLKKPEDVDAFFAALAKGTAAFELKERKRTPPEQGLGM